MSVIIDVYSNHTLSFDSYSKGIEMIEEALKIKIQDAENRKLEYFDDEHFSCQYTRFLRLKPGYNFSISTREMTG
jgi:hypothetical protein